MRKWVLAAFVSCAVVVAQTKPTDVFEKAPPQIEDPLRENIAKFFNAHVQGKFRQAEEVIAEDSKDFFYNMEKQRYLGFEIVRINYSENYAKATVVTAVELDWRSPRIGVMRVKPPMTSLWKQENGKWVWYVTPQKDWDTPWGKMHPGPDNPTNNKMMQLFKGVDAQTVVKQVAIDRTEMRLSGYEPSQGEAVIANSMPGEIQLRLEAPPVVGLNLKLDKTTLKNGEQAHIVAEYKPPTPAPKPAAAILVHVEPTGQVLRIALTFEVQPETKKALPKELQQK
jgi:hypothetical protein